MSERLGIVVTENAESQIRSAAQWWSENRDSVPTVLTDELEGAFNLITLHPLAGAKASNVNLPGVRRVLLRRTQFFLYYQVQEASQVVQVLAFWHTTRGSAPTI